MPVGLPGVLLRRRLACSLFPLLMTSRDYYICSVDANSLVYMHKALSTRLVKRWHEVRATERACAEEQEHDTAFVHEVQ